MKLPQGVWNGKPIRKAISFKHIEESHLNIRNCAFVTRWGPPCTNRRRVATDEKDGDSDKDDAQLVLLALLLEEPDLRTADQCEEREGMGVGVLSRVSARGLILLAWQSGLCITLTTTIIIKVINM